MAERITGGAEEWYEGAELIRREGVEEIRREGRGGENQERGEE